jgi:hypothetical protein
MPRWSVAIWCRRLAFGCLVVVASGLVIHVWRSNAGLTVFAIGMIFYLKAIAIIAGAFIASLRSFRQPRSSFWDLRRKLILSTFSLKE